MITSYSSEVGFNSLRNCISKLNSDDIELYEEFEYDFDKEEVVKAVTELAAE